MKNRVIGIILLFVTFLLGSVFYKAITDYRSFSSLQNKVEVRWQDEDNSCGRPRKSLFNDEWIIIDNPLCDFSADLQEIPSFGLSDFFYDPKLHDGRIIRVNGRYIYDSGDAFKCKFNMHDETLGEKHLGIGYWNSEIYTKIGAFVLSRKTNDNTVDVELIIQLIDVTDNPAAMEHNGHTPFNITILQVQKIK